MTGRNFVRSVKTRGNLLATQVRSARGREVGNVNCDLCHRQPETLGHVMQSCHVVKGARTARHDRIAKFTAARLRAGGHNVLVETPIPTPAGIRRPDLIAWHPERGAWVLDAQVVADATVADLGQAHARKVAYYHTEAITTHVRELSGLQPIVSSITINWRGALAPATVNSWAQLGLRKSDLTTLVAIALEGSAAIHHEFTGTSGGVRQHPY